MKHSTIRLLVTTVLLGAVIWVMFQGLGSLRSSSDPSAPPPVVEEYEETIVLLVDRHGDAGWIVRVDGREMSDEAALTAWLETQEAQKVLILTRDVDDPKSVGEVIAACRHADKTGERKRWMEPPTEDE